MHGYVQNSAGFSLQPKHLPALLVQKVKDSKYYREGEETARKTKTISEFGKDFL